MWKFFTFLTLITVSSARVAFPMEDQIKIPVAVECQIDVNGDLSEPQPLLIIPGTDQLASPNRPDGIVRLNAGQQLEVYCGGGFNNSLTSNPATLTCQPDGKFSNEGKSYDFKELYCEAYPFHTAVRNGKTCYNDASMIDIGFDVGSRFFKVLEICFDVKLERTYYVIHSFGPENSVWQSGFPRPSTWTVGGFFGGKDVNQIYTRVQQRATIAKIIGSDELALGYVPETSDMYMARGHLAAKVDVIFGSAQRATFYFLNTHPQWQYFNAGNWERVEDSIRKFVGQRNLQLEAYTGAFGVGSLIDINGQWQEIYLDFDENNNGLIPMPKIYYKIIIDKATRYGIALVGVNNPHVTLDDIRRDYIFCEDQSDKIDWVSWDKTNIRSGYSYACDVNELAAVVQHLPPLDVRGLLT